MSKEQDLRAMAEAVARWMGHSLHPWEMPPYADSLDAMREVEDEIERRGLLGQYEHYLFRIWWNNAESLPFHSFLIRLTAAQRLQAAYRVIQEVENAG